jgi:tRNA threonylcarbamoyladenosine biosynthesis protein TsaE
MESVMSFDFPYQQTTASVDETEALGAQLAQTLLSNTTLPRYIALRGDLGVGKTAFVRGFTRTIAPAALVRSPTFALVNEYHPPRATRLPSVFHFDMYRITSEDDLYSIGYDDYLDRGICLVEWSENIPYALPDDYLSVTIEKCGTDTPDQRIISIARE